MNREVYKAWEIKAIQPNHRSGAIFAVIVPVPGRGQDNVAALHLDASIMHSSEATITLDDKVTGKGSVAMSWRGLVGHNQLKPSVNGISRVRRLCIRVSLLIFMRGFLTSRGIYEH
ncbi:uncharacterized protein BDZ99DRAFT_469523 [Mytilinidion resinicola]|uniref:Uncharacterized protein n=1 Tax=Mytilinidion resinicola TaxID=574789 RepID=A0A6A6XZ02_9PEZI|nr:uncharacterized protein BDZ99DRAFT_469523 [Mytilinidion resinicola]KAF2801518.1 hypothetical protein BDZ99DRAFT_469523 [Mytilinidion resinicola]